MSDTWTSWLDIARAEGIPVLGQDWPQHTDQDELPMAIRQAVWGMQSQRDAEASGWHVSEPSSEADGRAR